MGARALKIVRLENGSEAFDMHIVGIRPLPVVCVVFFR